MLILLLAWAPAFGQKLSVGVKGGTGCATFLGQDFSDYLDSTGSDRTAFLPLAGGVFAEWDLGGNFALQPELLLLTLGGALTISGNEAAYYDWYIAPSVLAKARFGVFNVFAGPSILIELGRYTLKARADNQAEIYVTFEPNDAANLLFAATAGFGVQYPLGPGSLVAELRGLYSFTSYHTKEAMEASTILDWKPFSVTALAGYSLPVGK